jgi:hypothetical protein
MKDKKQLKKWLLYGGLGLGVLLILFLSTSIIPRALVLLTRASSSNKISIVNSYLIGEKILGKADGKDECIVNVFLLDKSGKGVANRTVELMGIDNVEKMNSLSNESGKVAFRVISNEEGQFDLQATIEGVELNQEVTVTFRK